MGTLNNFSNILSEVFIETGTRDGRTIMKAAGHYPECHSIEVIHQRFQSCKERISTQQSADSRANGFSPMDSIRLHLGSSVDVLPGIIDPLKTTTFWLDAHYSGERDKSEFLELTNGVECPLLEELSVITSFDSQWVSGWPLILIDDARLFNEAYWDSGRVYSAFDRSDWPTLEQIRFALPGFEVVDNGNDVLECRRV